MRVKNPYTLLGSGLLLTGGWLVPVAHVLLNSTPLSALGIWLIILGGVCLVLGRTRPKIPPEVSTILLETSLENISAIVEELGLTSKALYLPSSMSQGQPQALIPLHANSSLPPIEKALPRRLIVKYGPDPEDMGLLITSPGSAVAKMLESKPGATSAELGDALSSVLGGVLDVADSIKVGMNNKSVAIEVFKPRMEYKNVRLYECLGSPLASIAAALAAEALDKPIVIKSELHSKGKIMIELGILGEDLQ